MIEGLNVFPLTPMTSDGIDKDGLIRLIQRCRDANVDSITVLGSTGCGVYLTREERAETVSAAIENAGDIPVAVGIGALRASDVHHLADDAQNAGAAALLLAPVSYQELTPDEVFGLYEQVTARLSVPLIVYDNPKVTHFSFTTELYQAVAQLPHVAAIKLPGVPPDPQEARAFITRLKALLPENLSIGVARDPYAAVGLAAGCDAWHSVIGGVLPELALAIARAAQRGDDKLAGSFSAGCELLWDSFQKYGSLRVVATIAERLRLVGGPCLPPPLQGLGDEACAEVVQALEALAVLV